MRQQIPIICLLLSTLAFTHCKKTNENANNCFENYHTTRQIINKQAAVKLINNQFYLVEQFTIDTRLNPCNLAQEFRVNDLQVTISGDVKLTTKKIGEPCCTENFVITQIVK